MDLDSIKKVHCWYYFTHTHLHIHTPSAITHPFTCTCSPPLLHTCIPSLTHTHATSLPHHAHTHTHMHTHMHTLTPPTKHTHTMHSLTPTPTHPLTELPAPLLPISWPVPCRCEPDCGEQYHLQWSQQSLHPDCQPHQTGCTHGSRSGTLLSLNDLHQDWGRASPELYEYSHVIVQLSWKEVVILHYNLVTKMSCDITTLSQRCHVISQPSHEEVMWYHNLPVKIY